MHCNGERLSITSAMEWPQMKGERLLTAPNNKSATTANATATATATATSSATAANSSSACTDTHSKANMIHANSTTTAAATSNEAARAVDKPPGKDQHHQAALRCPRCDSSNTKFCYYNNYSLSQPRHFCKACKRYWTRGGTLRNVPVGGGCRKNKRAKKPTSSAAAHHLAPPSNPQQPRPRSLLPTDPIPCHGSANSSQVNAAALYALQMAASSSSSSPLSDMSLTLPIILNSLGNPSCAAASELLPHLGALGLGLSSNPQRDSADYLLGGLQPLPLVSSTATSTFLNHYQLSGSSLLPSASFLASGIKHLKQVENYDHVLLPFDEMQACGMSGRISGMMKEVKLEGQNNHAIDSSNFSSCIDWQIPPDNPLDNFGPATAMYWNAATGGWPEYGTNCSSSIAPVI